MVPPAGGLLSAKTLLVLRHARARRGSPSGLDRDRPLDERGAEDARSLGRRLAEEGLVPDLVLSSSAERALETARLAGAAGGFAGAVRPLDDLYGADPEECLEVLARHGAGCDRVLLVGHDPSVSELVERLTGRRRPLSAGALARIDFDPEDWEHLGRGVGRLEASWSPGA